MASSSLEIQLEELDVESQIETYRKLTNYGLGKPPTPETPQLPTLMMRKPSRYAEHIEKFNTILKRKGSRIPGTMEPMELPPLLSRQRTDSFSKLSDPKLLSSNNNSTQNLGDGVANQAGIHTSNSTLATKSVLPDLNQDVSPRVSAVGVPMGRRTSIGNRRSSLDTNPQETPSVSRRVSFDMTASRRASRDAAAKEATDSESCLEGGLSVDDRAIAKVASMTSLNTFRHPSIDAALTRHSAVATTVMTRKFGTSAIVAARRLAKRAAKRIKIRRMWDWAIHKVLRMIRATNAISEKRYRGAQELGFQLDNYRAVSKPEGVMKALTRAPENRTDEDLRTLEILIRSLPGFSRYSVGAQKDLGRVIQYSKFSAGRPVIKQGHLAQNFYYILSGELEIMKVIEGRNTWIGEMKEGMIFGELALLLEDSRRLATVITTKETELLWITRDDFEQVLKDETIRALEERKQMLAMHPFFSRLSSDAIQNLAITSQTIEVEPDTHILTEGDMPSYVYLVCEGEFRLSKCVHFMKVRCFEREKTTLHPFPLPRGIQAPFGREAVTKLLKIANVSEGEYYGAAAALSSAGAPNQVAAMNAMIDVVNGIRAPFSIISATRVKYITLSKHVFCKELIRYPELTRKVAREYVTLMKHFTDMAKIQSLYLEKHRWEQHKKRVMIETLSNIKGTRVEYKIKQSLKL
ncbi:hypothetical protein BCR33DRAFT_721795 [Rhizoclosmatium globosum]|uniref:Cyclic nucleotide-binding domain-containing protein n=1 Tax=Rhizoclosmatium globosum TaxID=329046 RepID=A0A1Y2BQ45_9FUNG|nr:hypothetical protein BCR33DRAFT_721795 [Rhizoclosmatium globosum]|eukprot:ORY36868.1 hypothetical protein BCR33DRAFT_721795 [Rhizoclosmatium globosum]